VPLEEYGHWPGLALPKDGLIQPSDAPGFGLDIPAEWLTPYG
jgi:L-rhamnonate dehydratase